MGGGGDASLKIWGLGRWHKNDQDNFSKISPFCELPLIF